MNPNSESFNSEKALQLLPQKPASWTMCRMTAYPWVPDMTVHTSSTLLFENPEPSSYTSILI